MGKLNKIISFDFDDTLCMSNGEPNKHMMDVLRYYAENGYRCYIVTARNKLHESAKWIANNQPGRVRVKDFIKEHGLPVKQTHFCNHEAKGPILKTIGVYKHYDDELEQVLSAREHGILSTHIVDGREATDGTSE